MHKPSFWLVMLMVLGLTISAPAAWAEAEDGKAAGEQSPPPRTPSAGASPAFVVESGDGGNRLQLGAVAQLDTRFAADDSQDDASDPFTVRRMRAIAQGRVARHVEFYSNVDLAGGMVNVKDAYVETRLSPAFRVRFGRMKSPTSYDRLLSIASILFVERGMTSAVAPDRETGLQILGDLGKGAFSYAVALTNGAVDGESGDFRIVANDVTGRLVMRPWVGDHERPLSGFGVALAASAGRQGAELPAFQTPGRQTYFSYADASADGKRTRWSPQAFYYHGPFGGYGEYMHSRGGVVKDGLRGDISHEAWQVAASWVLTGESASERNVRPRVAFDAGRRHFGAVQLAVRVQGLSVSRDAVRKGLAATDARRTANSWAVGLNWYPSPFIKWNLDFERTTFGRGASRTPEHAFLIRTQLAL
jgi:phosphate-selective porin OprO/OprP